jgi:hypothetical protein
MSSAKKQDVMLMSDLEVDVRFAVRSSSRDKKNTTTETLTTSPVIAALILATACCSAQDATAEKRLMKIYRELRSLAEYETERPVSKRKANSKRPKTGRSKPRSAAGSSVAID